MENSGSGSLCWVQSGPTNDSQACSGPHAGGGSYQSFAYDASGDRSSTTSSGYGSNTELNWNQDTHTLTCANLSGSTCTSPSSSTTATATYNYNAQGLRMQSSTWNSSTSSVQTTNFTWDTTSSALLSDGAYAYIYGSNTNVPIAQVNLSGSVTSQTSSIDTPRDAAAAANRSARSSGIEIEVMDHILPVPNPARACCAFVAQWADELELRLFRILPFDG